MAVLRYKENFVGVSNWAYELLETEDHPNLTHLSPKGKVVHHEPKRLSKDEAKAFALRPFTAILTRSIVINLM